MPRISSPALWLAVYFVLNLALTLYNKLVLIHFPFPYTLTALHALCGSIGSFLLLHVSPGGSPESKAPTIPTLNSKELVVILLFSVLYTVNIVVSNASLQLVTIPFHQCVRASAPLFTVALSALLLQKYSSSMKLATLVPVVAGVALATYGDYYYTTQGFILTLLGTLLAALKTIVTNVLQTPKSHVRPLFPPPPRPLTSPATPLYPPLSPKGPFKFPGPQAYPIEKQPSAGSIASSSSTSSSDGQTILYNRSAFNPGPIDDTSPSIPLPPPSPAPRSTSTFPKHHHRHKSHVINVHHHQPNTHVSSITKHLRLLRPLPHFPTRLPSLLDLPKLTLSPIQLLYLLSPLAFIQTTLLAHYTGELDRVNLHLHNITAHGQGMGMPDLAGWGVSGGPKSFPRMWLLFNGILAFMLNIVSFNANRKVGALGMTVAANVKQVLAVLCAIVLFNLTITPANALGILLTLLGGAWYAAVGFQERQAAAQASRRIQGGRRTLSFQMKPMVAVKMRRKLSDYEGVAGPGGEPREVKV